MESKGFIKFTLLLFVVLFGIIYGAVFAFQNGKRNTVIKMQCEFYDCENIYGSVWQYNDDFYESKLDCTRKCIKDKDDLHKTNKEEFARTMDPKIYNSIPEYQETFYYSIESMFGGHNQPLK